MARRITVDARLMGNARQAELAVERAESYRYFLAPLAKSNLRLEDMAKSLTAYKIVTPSGRGTWGKVQVRRILIRLGLYEGRERKAA